MKEHEIKNCRFCGDKGAVHFLYYDECGKRFYKMECMVCGLAGPYMKTKDEAVKMWNEMMGEQPSCHHENDTDYRDRVDRMVAAAYSGYWANTRISVMFDKENVVRTSIGIIDAIDKAIAEREARG